MFLTPEVLDLLEEVRKAVREGRLKEAEDLMLRVMDLLNQQHTPFRGAGWC